MGTTLMSQDEFKRKISSVFPNAEFGQDKYTFSISMTEAMYAQKRDRIVDILDEVLGFVFFISFQNDKLTLSLNE